MVQGWGEGNPHMHGLEAICHGVHDSSRPSAGRGGMQRGEWVGCRRGGGSGRVLGLRLLAWQLERSRELKTEWRTEKSVGKSMAKRSSEGQDSSQKGFREKRQWLRSELQQNTRADEEISSLSHSVVFLYFFALIAEEGFLISFCYSLELCILMGISFLFSFAFHSSFSQLFVRPPQTTVLLLCISFSWEWSWSLPPV